MTSGFLTLGIWAMSGFTITLLRHLFPSFTGEMAHLFGVVVMACTPTIWIARNQQILKDFVSYFRGDISPDNPENELNGGVWIGP